LACSEQLWSGVVVEALRRLACVTTPGASGLASRSVDFDG
jgi:hypothetical protein